MNSNFRWITLLIGMACLFWQAQGQRASASPIVRISGHVAEAGRGIQSGQSSEAPGQTSSQPVWDSSFDSQFKKIVAAAAHNFASVVKDGADGAEVDLDLSVLGDTDTCGYVEGGSIGAPVCIFQFDAGQDQAPARRDFDALMAHIKTLLPDWKERAPDSEGEGQLEQFATDNQSVKCSMEWSNSSASYAIYVNFLGHPIAKAKPRRKTQRRQVSGDDSGTS